MIERHENVIAQHTAIQSRTNILNLIFGVITTTALIYISYQQYAASDRQVELEYAKVAPQFAVDLELFSTEMSPAIRHAVPKAFSIRVVRGEPIISRIEVYQDFRVSAILTSPRNGQPYQPTCHVRSNNYFKVNESGTSGRAAALISGIANSPSFYYPVPFSDFFIVSPEMTYVKIYYQDIFGKERSVIFVGNDRHLSQLPADSIPRDSLYEIADAEFSDSRTVKTPKLWSKPLRSPKGEGCKYILFNSPLVA